MHFGDFLKNMYNKEFPEKDLDEVIKNFYKKTIEKIGKPTETCIGGLTSYRVYFKEKEGFESVYYFIGIKEKKKLLEIKGNNFLNYAKKQYGRIKDIEDFMQKHGGHVYLEFTPTFVNVCCDIKSVFDDSRLDLTDYTCI